MVDPTIYATVFDYRGRSCIILQGVVVALEYFSPVSSVELWFAHVGEMIYRVIPVPPREEGLASEDDPLGEISDVISNICFQLQKERHARLSLENQVVELKSRIMAANEDATKAREDLMAVSASLYSSASKSNSPDAVALSNMPEQLDVLRKTNQMLELQYQRLLERSSHPHGSSPEISSGESSTALPPVSIQEVASSSQLQPESMIELESSSSYSAASFHSAISEIVEASPSVPLIADNVDTGAVDRWISEHFTEGPDFNSASAISVILLFAKAIREGRLDVLQRLKLRLNGAVPVFPSLRDDFVLPKEERLSASELSQMTAMELLKLEKQEKRIEAALQKRLEKPTMVLLFAAIRLGNADLVSWLVREHRFPININPADTHELSTSMHIAAGEGNVSVLQALKNLGANFEVISVQQERLPVHCAAANGHLEALKWMHGNGVNVKRSTMLGTVVHAAVRHRHLHVLEWFSTIAPARFFTERSVLGTPASIAASKGDLEVLKLVHKASGRNEAFKAVAGAKTSVLHEAAKRGHMNIVMWLKEHNALHNLQNSAGNTPLSLASQKKHQEIVEILKTLQPTQEQSLPPTAYAAVASSSSTLPAETAQPVSLLSSATDKKDHVDSNNKEEEYDTVETAQSDSEEAAEDSDEDPRAAFNDSVYAEYFLDL